MTKYKKKPVVIEAVQWKGVVNSSYHNAIKVHNFLTGLNAKSGRDLLSESSTFYIENGNLFIKTLEGVMKADKGDYIIKGIKGEYYPCKPDIFEQTYERVNDMAKKTHNFCETPEEKCTMNYCDDNGCQNRKRNLVSDKEKADYLIKTTKFR